MPSGIFRTNDSRETGTQLAFYWINGDELVTCQTGIENYGGFESDNFSLIKISGGITIIRER